MKRLKRYRKKNKKNYIFLKLLVKTLVVFIIITSSIVLYDMYINIEAEPIEDYSAEKLSKEISTNNTSNISDTLEIVTRSVVRNIKNRRK